ncbi:MAG: GAK system CofD-like protein [Myxococcales bacterium]|nr:GAK system CofD-like protein [Myxococcales bacterium]MDD9969601.1 GAK system CofD-like protein [Myxococcales bacterium]
MSERIPIRRAVHVPSETALARSLRAPELGPRILLFSGGSALKRICHNLKDYTHNSIHLITPFDSGGSSAKLRESFQMLSVGDLRNRLMALADEGALGNPEIYALFSHRLETDATAAELREQLESMVLGRHDMVAAVPEPMRRIVQVHLRHFASRMPDNFDLRAASIGNLILAGGYLANDRDIESVIFLFSKLVNVRGIVRPTVDIDLHLAAEMASGEIILGQHKLTGKETAPLSEPIEQLQLTRDLKQLKRAGAEIDDKTRKLIMSTDLICYPVGSFYTSVIANLLPSGVGEAVCQRTCPKVYIPNFKGDPEQVNTTVCAEIDSLLEYIRQDAGSDVPTDRIMNLVLLHTDLSAYGRDVNLEGLERRGLTPLQRPILAEDGLTHDPLAVAQILLSLA